MMQNEVADEMARARMGSYARARAVRELRWPSEKPKLWAAYRQVLGERQSAPSAVAGIVHEQSHATPID